MAKSHLAVSANGETSSGQTTGMSGQRASNDAAAPVTTAH